MFNRLLWKLRNWWKPTDTLADAACCAETLAYNDWLEGRAEDSQNERMREMGLGGP